MKKIVVMLAFGLMMCTASFAQTQKIGYINSKELLALMPEMKKAETDLTAFAKQYKEQMESMQKEGEKKVADYQAASKTMTEAVRTVKETEIQDLQARMQKFQQTAEQKVSEKESEILKPIYDKANKAISDVAKEKGYTVVFDSGAGNVLYATDGDNLLAAVKTKLAIK